MEVLMVSCGTWKMFSKRYFALQCTSFYSNVSTGWSSRPILGSGSNLAVARVQCCSVKMQIEYSLLNSIDAAFENLGCDGCAILRDLI